MEHEPRVVVVESRNGALTAAAVGYNLVTAEQASARLHAQNVGDLERALRVGAGLAGLLAARHAPAGWRLPLAALALSTTVSGLTGWCPTYATLGLTSIGGPMDRPGDAERRSWWERIGGAEGHRG